MTDTAIGDFPGPNGVINHAQLTQLLIFWNEQRRQGNNITAGELCRECPELLTEVERGIELLRLLNSALPETIDSAPAPLPETIDSAPVPLPVAAPKKGPLPQLPGYVFVDRLGEGGMGVVYKAVQAGLRRTVALKMILAGQFAGQDQLSRFRREAEAVAQLRHPNIVQIYEIGEHEGRPFFTLEYVEGGSLDRRIRGTPFAEREAARLVVTLARAIHSAHQSGIIHRDLKPANILLTADGSPKIADFGLAKQLADDSEQTRSGAILGTPSYMAPEQAAGQTRQIGPAVDIYALGAILYELLTGRPPFRAAQPLDTLKQVIGDEPVPLRVLNPHVERDLETICLACLSKAPGARYGSALARADDLQRYLNGEAISARPTNILGDVARALRGNYQDPVFQNWAAMLGQVGVILLLTHLAMLFLILIGIPYPGMTHQRVKIVQFALIAVVLWRHRQVRRSVSMSRAERQLWAIWIGFGLGGLMVFVVGYLQDSPQRVWPPILYPLPMYPYWSILSGLAFFALGSSYSGRFYLHGLAFFLLAGVMPLHEGWSPLAFGLLWALALIGCYFAFRKMGRCDGEPS